MSLPAWSILTERAPVTLVSRLREMAMRGLAQMYRPDEGLFAFRIRRRGNRLLLEGSSLRYTAIALIGLTGEDEAAQVSVLAGVPAREACARLVSKMDGVENLGDVALALWASCAAGYPERRRLAERLLALQPEAAPHPTVEVAWTLAALCVDRAAPLSSLRTQVARRLIASFDTRSGMFPHGLGGRSDGLRGHVSCFADLVYPIHALARYADLFGDRKARGVALRCAREICSLQGPDGQWWWHYDRRTGKVVERYPAYAVHQDAMAPMALFAIEGLAGVDLRPSIVRGLAWLARAPELGGRSLVDPGAGMIWRKVARREPAKLSRYLQAATSRLHPTLRTPGLDLLFPACVVDYEDRPYHLGWLLYAWPAARAARWDERAMPL